MNMWAPEPGDRLFFIGRGRSRLVQVQFVCRSDRFDLLDDGGIDLKLKLDLDSDSEPLTQAENLAVEVLRGDELAALAAADDVLERFNRPEGFETREELKARISELERDLKGARKLADYRMHVIEQGNCDYEDGDDR